MFILSSALGLKRPSNIMCSTQLCRKSRELRALFVEEEKKIKTFGTRDSRVIPGLSTKRARGDLTAQFEMGWGICRPGMAECITERLDRKFYTLATS